MRLLAIDDFEIDEASFYERPMITDRSNRLEWSTKRRQGVAGSVFFGGQAEPAKWNIVFKCNDLETRDAVLAVLGGDVTDERRLLAIRDDVAQTRVIALAAPLKINEINELDVSVDFESSDSVWRSESAEETTKSFTSTLDQAMHLVVPGNTRTAPRIILTPTLQRSVFTATVGFRYRRRYVIANNSDEPLYRYPMRISLGDTTPLTTTKAQADGDDVRVIIDGIEVERTLVTWDTAASFVWFIVEALPAGESMTVEVWYGNASATNPPVLAYPNLPAIILASSANNSWSYPIDDVAANKGLGTWHLSQTTDGPVADFTVPAAWRRMATLQTPDNQDNRFQTSYRLFTDTGTWALAGLDAWRSANGYLSFASGFVGLPQLNPYDGIGISHPLGLVSVTTTFKVINVNAVGRLVILMRDATSEDWTWLFTDGAVHATEATIASATYTPAVPVHHLALAVWPQYLAYIPDDTVGYVRARLDASLVLAINDSLISITGGAEEEIYEIATELRIGGGADRVPPYRSLLIGNARGDSGAGVPRCGVLLTQALDIDGDEMTHEVWDSALTAKVEDVSAHAIQPVIGYDSHGTTAEGPSNLMLPLAPARTRVPNGDFEADLTNWVDDAATAGVTFTRDWDGTIGGAQNGSLKVAISANSAGIGATVNTIGTKYFPINDRASVEMAAWVRTSNVNLTPRLYVRFYDADAVQLASVAIEADWAPVANTGVRRALASRVPSGAAFYRLGLFVFCDTAGATGNVWFDDITTNNVELIVADQAMGTLGVTVGLQGRWLA